MERISPSVESRLIALETKLRHMRLIATVLASVMSLVVLTGFVYRQQPSIELRTKRLVVVDDSARVRVILGQDAANTQRRSRAAGLTIFDRTGAERGGLSTMDDGSVVFGMDAPEGVGSPMRDRIGLLVGPDGASYVMLLDNSTRAVAKLQSDGQGGGGVQVFSWDMRRHLVRIRTV